MGRRHLAEPTSLTELEIVLEYTQDDHSDRRQPGQQVPRPAPGLIISAELPPSPHDDRGSSVRGAVAATAGRSIEEPSRVSQPEGYEHVTTGRGVDRRWDQAYTYL